MDQAAPDSVGQVLGRLLRHPEPQRDIELERALLRLQAARPDAAYLLLHRVMVLETALARLRQGGDAVAPGVPTAPAATRSFLRDAAVVTAGVVAAQALWGGISGGAATEGDAGLDLEGWL